MKSDLMLMIPGPTPVPEAVLEALGRPPVGHRSQEFKAVLKEVYSGLQWIFQTERYPFLYTSSGTGAMEAALVNTLNPGDTVLVLSCGVFSNRWAEIAKSLGLDVHVQAIPQGEANSSEELEKYLKNNRDKRFKAVCMIHSETSTGVLNPLEELARVVKEQSDAIVVVDAVTSLAATRFEFDSWGIDIAVSGSQKGFMIPPGLAFLVASGKAMELHRKCKAPGYYFNFSKYEKETPAGQTPFTPAVSLTQGLQMSLRMLKEEGLEGIFSRHRLNQQMIRAAARGAGLQLFVESDAISSPSVTSILPPEGVSVDSIRSGMREQFNITIANGQKELMGKIFRIGHLGAIFPRDMLTVVSALETVLHQAGFNKTALGSAVSAAQRLSIMEMASHEQA